jgi:hypothetical protein
MPRPSHWTTVYTRLRENAWIGSKFVWGDTHKNTHERTDGRTDIISQAFLLNYQTLRHFLRITTEALRKAHWTRGQSRTNSVLRTHTSPPALTVRTKRLFNATKRSPVSATSLVVTWSMKRSTCHINRHVLHSEFALWMNAWLLTSATEAAVPVQSWLLTRGSSCPKFFTSDDKGSRQTFRQIAMAKSISACTTTGRFVRNCRVSCHNNKIPSCVIVRA